MKRKVPSNNIKAKYKMSEKIIESSQVLYDIRKDLVNWRSKGPIHTLKLLGEL